MKWSRASIKEIAAKVSDFLENNNIDVVLTGGACVVIYSENKYMSYDLDFVLMSYDDRKRLGPLLQSIGFEQKGRYYIHPHTPFFLDFLYPPLSVGQEPVQEISQIQEGKGILKLLSPTDCVKDRLAAYYHWNDLQSLDQALLVCNQNKVDLREVERWSTNEGMKEKFKNFKKKL